MYITLSIVYLHHEKTINQFKMKLLQKFQERRLRIKAVELAAKFGTSSKQAHEVASRIENYILTGTIREDSSTVQNSPSHE